MQVVNHLARFTAHVKDDFVARKALLFREMLRGKDNVSDNLAVISLKMRDGLDVLLGHHKTMHGRRRPDIVKRNHLVVFIHNLRRYFLFYDSTKKTIFHVCYRVTEIITKTKSP